MILVLTEKHVVVKEVLAQEIHVMHVEKVDYRVIDGLV
jgi:hypothetical protein